MAQVAIPDAFFEVVTHFSHTGNTRPVMNVMGVGYDIGEPLQDSLDQLQIAFVDFAGHFSDEYTLDQLTVRIGAAAPPYLSLPVAINVNGTNGLTPCAPNTSVLMKKFGGLAGRHGRGRNFWAGLAFEDNVNGGGVIDAAEVTSLQGFADDLMAALNVAPLLGAYILHPDTFVGTPTALFGYVADSMVATQRRRLR